MRVTTSIEIVAHKILNETTGELELKDFVEVKQTKRMQGGFRMTYLSYDKAVLQVITSKKDLEIVVHVRDMFTYKQVENTIKASELGKSLGVTRQKTTTLLKRMVEVGLLKKVKANTYRLNPYMYIPFRADASELQREWSEL